ncbi:uncharacterized protein LOC110773973, partial [Prunus avium]|uniref:Uncharacterized protein LOC110773973 n=1 Tax=Prunus avium TaxID=42229 RepID=A0A6P5U4C2_PRUAV
MSKTNGLRREISEFRQSESEQFYESWERFKDLTLKCPHHGFEKWRLVQSFYNGLTQTSRNMIESMNRGAFLQLREVAAYEFLENLSVNSQQWDFSNTLDKQIREPKKGGMYEVRSDSDLGIKIESLTRKVEALALSQNMNSVNKIHTEICSLCCSPTHSEQTCPSSHGYAENNEQANALNYYRNQFPSPFSETYNPNWRNHPNFSWRSNQPQNSGGNPSQNNQLCQPPVPQPTPQFVATQQQQSSSLEDSIQKFMQLTGQAINDVKASTQQNTQAISKLEQQIGQLATVVGEREKGKFPSQTVPNPKGQFVINNPSSSPNSNEHVQSITTLRSGKHIGNQDLEPHLSDKNELIDVETQKSNESHPHALSSTPFDPPRNFISKAPFPHRLANSKKSAQFGDILEVFKQVQINIPFLDAINQIPSYAKFLKDLCTFKRKTNVSKKAFLTEHISSIIENRIPIKYKDPGCPTIACMIGDHHIETALLDLGASVNLLPYSMYKQLGLGEIKPTRVSLSLADRSVKIPRGIVEDVLIKVDKFYFPVDFIILDTQPVPSGQKQIPVILGRPFLAT